MKYQTNKKLSLFADSKSQRLRKIYNLTIQLNIGGRQVWIEQDL